jgi:hypothetical protein
MAKSGLSEFRHECGILKGTIGPKDGSRRDQEHAAAMEEAAGVLSNRERLTLLRLLKKLGKGREFR